MKKYLKSDEDGKDIGKNLHGYIEKLESQINLNDPNLEVYNGAVYGHNFDVKICS